MCKKCNTKKLWVRGGKAYCAKCGKRYKGHLSAVYIAKPPEKE